MRLMGLTKPRANRKPQHDASTMATTVAIAMAWYELLRNSSSAERRSVSDPSTHTFTEPTAWPSTSMVAVAIWSGEGFLGASEVLPRPLCEDFEAILVESNGTDVVLSAS